MNQDEIVKIFFFKIFQSLNENVFVFCFYFAKANRGKLFSEIF